MSEWPKISVVIATLNRSPYLKKMLDNLFKDDYPNLEVIVIDGASKDDTVELLKSYGNKISKWKSEPDQGEYFAINKGLQMATGEIIKPMTDDDILRPGVFFLAAEYFATHPDIDIVFGQAASWREENGKVSFIEESSCHPERLSLHHWLRETHGFNSIAAFIRSSVFRRIGLFSTEYCAGDVEYWTRAAHLRIKMGLMPQVVVDYYYRDFMGVITKWREIARDRFRINVRYGSIPDIAVSFWKDLAKFYIYAQLVKFENYFGFGPLRVWRKWRHRT